MILFKKDCVLAMKQMMNDCVDSIVTDPPYELGFMGKSWDGSGIAYSVEMWSEALRILKPGGHLLAFGGTRTYHRMACAIEDAGFEIRDSIHWIYGSGFPKSHNVSLGIDKANGVQGDRGSAINVGGKGERKDIETSVSESNGKLKPAYSDAKSPEAKTWQGWGTALKPAHEPIVVARKPLIGTVAANVLEHGTGALNIDGARVGDDGGHAGAGAGARVFGDGLNGPRGTPVLGMGRWPANLIFGHDEDCEQLGTTKETLTINKLEQWSGFGEKLRPDYQSSSSTVNVAVWKCTPGCAVAELDAQSSGASRFFYCAKASKFERNAGLEGLEEKEIGGKGNGLARTCGTCGTSVLDGCDCPDRTFNNPTRKNFHPTVKPLDLMRYLVRLVTPPGGVVFDPFLGSGTTAVATILEGKIATGAELTEDYYPIIEARVEWAVKKRLEAIDTLFGKK